MKHVYLFIIAFLLWSCDANKKMVQPKSTFSFLTGEWAHRGNNSVFTETWRESPDGQMLGLGLMVTDKMDTLQAERIRIIAKDGHYYYVPQVSNQNQGKEVFFKIEQYTDSSFVAFNPAHDFPKRILYQRKSKDYLFVRVDDGQDVPEKKLDFHLVRKFGK